MMNNSLPLKPEIKGQFFDDCISIAPQKQKNIFRATIFQILVHGKDFLYKIFGKPIIKRWYTSTFRNIQVIIVPLQGIVFGWNIA